MDLQNPRTPRFSTEFLNELRSRTSLELVAADYLDLKPAGVGRVKALCPVHSERTPSFTINIDWGRFHCFGCGASGDAIDFLMQVDGLRFVESVSELANRAGLAVPQGSDSFADNDLRARNELRSVLEKAQQLTSEWLLTLPEGRAARDFLRARSFTSEHAQEWGLGYNPVGGNALSAALTAAGHPLEIQRDAGITKEGERGHYDAFRGRLMWPIHDPQGRIVGFTGRDLTGTAPAKYLNTSGTDLFHKGDLLFGYDAMSLALCLCYPESTIDALGGRKVRVDGNSATVDRWPFAEEDLTVSVWARTFTDRFDDESELHRALAAATYERREWTLRPA